MKRISGILTGLSFVVLGVACGNGEDMDSTNCKDSMPANTIYVAADSKAASPDGTSWSKAFKNLQPAIDAGFKQLNANKVTRVTIAVKQGTYQPTGSQNIFENYVNSLGNFRNLAQVDVWGGFKGQSLCKEDQDKALFEKTILSGVIAGTNAKKPDQKNALHVLDFYNPEAVQTDIKITGFKITGGQATNTSNQGGGVTINNAAGNGLVFDNVWFDQNKSEGPGGGMYIAESNVSITNSKFTGNTAHSGGAIRLFSGSATIGKTQFTNNIASGGGAAVEVSGALTMNGYTQGKLAPDFANNSKKDISTSGKGTVKYNP